MQQFFKNELCMAICLGLLFFFLMQRKLKQVRNIVKFKIIKG